MSTSSHISCKNCGARTHKRNGSRGQDLCWKCWRAQGVPLLKAERQRIKMSRRKRRQAARQGSLHGAMSEPEQLVLEESTQPVDESIIQETPVVPQLADLIAEVRPLDHAAYMRSFIGKPRLAETEEQEILRLYEDPSIPLHEISAAYNVGLATVGRVIKKHGVAMRDRSEVMRQRHARARQAEGRLERIDGEMQWVTTNGTHAEPAPAEKEPENMVSLSNLSDESKRAIAEAYDQTGIPANVITEAYGINSDSQLYTILQEYNVTLRRDREGPLPARWKGHYEQGPRGPVWVHDDSQPSLHVDDVQADVVIEEDPGPEQLPSLVHNGGPVRITTPEQEDEVVEAYRAGKTIKEIATAFGISDAVIYRRLKERGVQLRRGRPGRLYRNGTEIARAAPFPRNGQLAVMERAWLVEYTIRGRRMLNAPSLEEALRQTKEIGANVEIHSINPA